MNNPRVYIRDRNDMVVDVLEDTDYIDFKIQRVLEGAATVVYIEFLKTPNLQTVVNTTTNISFIYRDVHYWLTAVIVDQSAKTMKLTAWSLGLEFNNENVGPYSAPKAMTFAEYIGHFDWGKVLTIGVNEVSSKSLKLSWDGESTVLARLFSVAKQFNAEIEFISTLNKDGSLKQITLNAVNAYDETHNGLGQDRREFKLYSGNEIRSIRKSESKIELFTAIKATGKDGLTIKNIEREWKNSAGVVEFYTKKGQDGIYAPLAKELYPSNLMKTNPDYWTVRYAGETQYETDEGLCAYMLGELKKWCVPELEWEIEGYVDTDIGDQIRIEDHNYNPTLYLDVRVIGQVLNIVHPMESTTTFSNVRELQSEIDDSILSTINKLIIEGQPYRIQLDMIGDGLIFKNNSGETTITARVLKGSIDRTDDLTYRWYQNDVVVATNNSITLKGSDISGSVLYHLEVFLDGISVVNADVTLTNVNDGESSYMFNVYAWNSKGTDRFTLLYPNVNMLPDSMAMPLSKWRQSPENVYELLPPDPINLLSNVLKGIRSTNNGQQMAYSERIYVEAGKTYTVSFWYKDIGFTARTQIAAFRIFPDPVSGFFESETVDKLNVFHTQATPEWTYISNTITPKADGYLAFYTYCNSRSGQMETFYTGIKIEEGSIGTIYTPNPNQSYDDAIPLFIGTATNSSTTQPTSPSEYRFVPTRSLQPYTHYAYAWSSDGTDRFTWVYPQDTTDYPSYSGIAVTFDKQPPDAPKAYTWVRILGEQGEDGESVYTWVAYADDIHGFNLSFDPNNKRFKGYAYNKQSPNPSTNPTDYTWEAIYNEDDVMSVVATIPKTTVSATPPTDPKNGDLWWVMSNNQVTDIRVFGENQWYPQKIDQQVMNIRTLNAVTISSSEITGALIQNTFDEQVEGSRLQGYVRMQGSKLQSNYDIANGYQTGGWSISPQYITSRLNYPDGSLLDGYSIQPSGIELLKNTLPGNGTNIKYKATLTIDELIPQAQTFSVNVSQAGSTARINLTLTRYMKMVFASVQIQILNSFAGGERVQAGVTGQGVTNNQLPVAFRPVTQTILTVERSAGQNINARTLLIIYPDGVIRYTQPGSTASAYVQGNTSWLVSNDTGSLPLQ